MRIRAAYLFAVGFLIVGAISSLPSGRSLERFDLLEAPVGPAAAFSFSDSTFADADWADRIVIDENGGTSPTYTAEQVGFGLPGPSRHILHTFTCDPNITTRMAEASWATTSYFEPAGEAVQFVSFRFDIYAANVAVHPVVVQADTVYLGRSQQLIFPFVWKAFEAQELEASDFSHYPTNQHPDFTRPMMFGYATDNSSPSGQTNCPREIPTDTWVDNFQVRVNESVPAGGNHLPIARDDILVARISASDHSYAEGSANVLHNDYDPDGDSLWIPVLSTARDGLFGGRAIHKGAGEFEFTWSGVDSRDNAFSYWVTDGAATVVGTVLVLIDCACVISCYLTIGKLGHRAAQEIDLDFIRRFRDEAMETTEHGARFVDLYYNRMPEMLKLLIIDYPDLGQQAVEMVALVQPVLQNYLDGDGTMPFTQEQMDAIGQFASDLSAVSSDSLTATIGAELARLGPLDSYVGRPVAEALGTVLGDPISTGVGEPSNDVFPVELVLEQNYPNPFNPATTISYRVSQPSSVTLSVYDVLGRHVSELASGTRQAGAYEVSFDATGLPSGIYFYRLRAGDYIETKHMVVVR